MDQHVDTQGRRSAIQHFQPDTINEARIGFNREHTHGSRHLNDTSNIPGQFEFRDSAGTGERRATFSALAASLNWASAVAD